MYVSDQFVDGRLQLTDYTKYPLTIGGRGPLSNTMLLLTTHWCSYPFYLDICVPTGGEELIFTVLATVVMSVCLSVCYVLAVSQNDAC